MKMRAIREIVNYCEDNGVTFPEAVLSLDSEATGVPVAEIRKRMAARLTDMERSVREAAANTESGTFVTPYGPQLRDYGAGRGALSGPFTVRAASVALDVAVYNAVMGRIVAAPTAGSSGILPGILYAWGEKCGLETGAERERLLDGLIVAGGVGEVIAYRATLSGAEGGCQAECGSAAAMASAALVHLEGGSPEQVSNAAALTFISVMGLVCDPVGGLVELPCVKRNGLLVSLAVFAADMSMAGIECAIPADEVIDAMGRVGRDLPDSLRETSLGGIAATPTAKRMAESAAPSPKWPESKSK